MNSNGTRVFTGTYLSRLTGIYRSCVDFAQAGTMTVVSTDAANVDEDQIGRAAKTGAYVHTFAVGFNLA